MTLDFVRDLAETIKGHGLEFLVVVIQRGKKSNRVDFFQEVKDREGIKILKEALETALKEINKLDDK
jgi:hypothetical protein